MTVDVRMKRKKLFPAIFCVVVSHVTCDLLMTMSSSSRDSEELTVAVTGTREAVIDSQVQFTARVMNGSAPWATNSTLRYEWCTDACISLVPFSCWCEAVTYGHGSSSLTRVLTRYDVKKEGSYHMFVTVSTVSGSSFGMKMGILIEGNQKFNLTDKLNGQLFAEQTTSVTRPPSVYSTESLLTLGVSLSDMLHNVWGINYTWLLHCHNSTATSTYHTTVPVKKIEALDKGTYTISVSLDASMDITDHKNITHIIRRDGTFHIKAVFIDPIKSTVFNGNTSYMKGSNMTASIQCYGSAPFSLNATITDPNQNTVLVEYIQSRNCDFSVAMKNLNTEGPYIIVYSISNPVAEVRRNVTLHVHSPPADVTSDLVPVFAVLIGLLSPFVIIYVYIRERSNKSRIEAANFSFRPLHMEHDTYRTIKTKVKKWAKFFMKRKTGTLSRNVSMQGFGSDQSGECGEQTETSPVKSGTSSSGYGALSSSDRFQASGRASNLPWLERSSEHSRAGRYCSPWLLERPTSPWSVNYTQDSLGTDCSPSQTSSTNGSPYLV